MQGVIMKILRPPNFAAIQFLVKIDGVSSDETLKKLLMKKPNQTDSAHQIEEQKKLGEPVLRCKNGDLSRVPFKDGAWVLQDYMGLMTGERVVIRDSWSGLTALKGTHGRIVDIRRTEHRRRHGDGVRDLNGPFFLVLPEADDKATAALLRENEQNNPACACFAWKRLQEGAHGRPLLLCALAHVGKEGPAAKDEGPAAKDEGPAAKDEGPAAKRHLEKVEGPADKGEGPAAKRKK
jgi:hypothetical protein